MSYPSHAAPPSNRPRPARSTMPLVLIAALLLIAGCGTGAQPPTGGAPPEQPTAATATPPPEQPTAATVAPPEPATFSETGRVSVAADGAPHADAAGAGVTLPPDALEAGNSLELIASSGQGWLVEQLGRVAVVDTAFYSLHATGDRDPRRPVELRLPAAGPASRAVAIVDGAYLFVYAAEPEGGALTISAAAPPAAPPELGGDPMGAPGTIQYAVIGPRAAAAPGWEQALGVRVAHAQEAGAYRYCLAMGDIPVELRTCRMNRVGSAQVAWSQGGLVNDATADAVLAAVEEGMGRFAALNLDEARLSSLDPVKVIVRPGDESPHYNSTLGVVYIGLRAAERIGTQASRLELWHELFHFIEDENYAMLWGFVNGDLRWWLELAAEVGVFMIEPAAAEHSATLYGRSSLDDMRTLVFQLSPYQWAADEQYLQAHLLRANICASGCPLTQEGFVKAINAGDYPFQDEALRAKLRSNLDRYASYLMTGDLDSAAAVGAFRGGAQIGDYVAVGSGTPFKLETNSYPPQVQTDPGRIEAPLQPDSVYPLLISSGAASQGPLGYPQQVGHPLMLTVEPGVEVLYSLGGGEVRRHDGAKPLVIAPVHEALGYPQVRLLAVARGAPATFKAKLEPVDLSGDWVFTVTKATPRSNTCPPEDEDDADISQAASLLTQLNQYVAPLGSYATRDGRVPGDLEYVLDPGKSLKEKPDDPDMTYTASLSVEDKAVVADMELFIPPPQKEGQGPGAGAALLLAPPVGAALLARRRRRGAALLLALLAVSLLTGCVGVGISGTIGSNLSFAKLEYVAAPDAPDKPLWRLSDGSGTFLLDLTIEVGVTSLDSSSEEGVSTTEETRHCQAEVAISAVGELYRDGVVQPPAD